MRRGDIVIAAPPGEYGKPRPVLVIQADMALADNTLTYLPITSDLSRFGMARVFVANTNENGLLKPSEVMVDLISTSPFSKVRQVIGRIDDQTMQAVERALMLHLGLV